MADLCRLIWCALVGLFRSRASREAEILALRHQLNVLRRKSPKRPTFSGIDRLVFAGLYRLAPGVLNALTIIKPETVIRWHRAGFRAYWRWKSRPYSGRPKTPWRFAGSFERSVSRTRSGAHLGSMANSSSLASMLGKQQLQSTWRGVDDRRLRDGRRSSAITPTASHLWICSSSPRSRSDCYMDC